MSMINAQLPAWLNMSGARMMGEWEELNFARARTRALKQQMQMAQQQMDRQMKDDQDYNQSLQSLMRDMQSVGGGKSTIAPQRVQMPDASRAQFDYLLGGSYG